MVCRREKSERQRSAFRRIARPAPRGAGEGICGVLLGTPAGVDAAELYVPPDGYLDAKGEFRRERSSPQDKAVFEIDILPEDGVYPLPYMARQADGQAWEEECATPGAPADKARGILSGWIPQLRIDRLSVGPAGIGNLISSFADVDFYRMLPTGGYTRACRQLCALMSVRVISSPRSAASISSPTNRFTSTRIRRGRASRR